MPSGGSITVRTLTLKQMETNIGYTVNTLVSISITKIA